MKRQPAKVFVALYFLVLLLHTSASAQVMRPTQFHIPFNFIIQGESLPAGKYTIERLDKTKPEILIMKNSDGRTRRIFLTQRVDARDYKEVALLVFNRFGDDHILSQVWGAGERSGRELPGSSSKNNRSGKPIAVLVKGALVKSR